MTKSTILHPVQVLTKMITIRGKEIMTVTKGILEDQIGKEL